MTQSTIKQRLTEARALIDQPEKWTQGVSSLNTEGGVAYCAREALVQVCGDDEDWADELSVHLIRSINRPAEYEDSALTDWNDAPTRTHAEVMQAFDRAIAEGPTGGM